MINYSCPGCGAALHIGDEWAGRQVRCPHCQNVTWLSMAGRPGAYQSPVMAPRRSSKLRVLFRFLIIPAWVLASYAAFLGWEIFVYGMIGLGVIVFLLWAFVNFFTFIGCPREYRLWKAGGGDPFIDTLPEPFNNDPAEVRYQEMFREQARQEDELVLDDLPPPPSAELPRNLKEFGDLLR